MNYFKRADFACSDKIGLYSEDQENFLDGLFQRGNFTNGIMLIKNPTTFTSKFINACY